MGEHDEIKDRMAKDEEVVRVVREAVQSTVADQSRRGYPIVAWRDGRTVWIAADGTVSTEPPEQPQ